MMMISSSSSSKILLALFAVMCVMALHATCFQGDKVNIAGRFGAEDTLETGVPHLVAGKRLSCIKMRTDNNCDECCQQNGYDKHIFKKRLGASVPGLKALQNTCQCLKSMN